MSDPTNLKLIIQSPPVLRATVTPPIEIKSTLVVGQGPAGPPGAGEEMKYSKRVDFVGEQVIYKGESVPGSLETESKWRIRKITFVGEDIFETWADGDSLFNKQWSNREFYNYI